MNEQLAIVTDWLLEASSEVAPNYLRLPVAGTDVPQYRERVYCYELSVQAGINTVVYLSSFASAS